MAESLEVGTALKEILIRAVRTPPIKTAILSSLNTLKTSLLAENALLQIELAKATTAFNLITNFGGVIDSTINKSLDDINILPFKNTNNGQLKRLMNKINDSLSLAEAGRKSVARNLRRGQQALDNVRKKVQDNTDMTTVCQPSKRRNLPPPKQGETLVGYRPET